MITSAAVKHPFTGQIAEGITHPQAWLALAGDGPALDELVNRIIAADLDLGDFDGFMTDAGTFVDRAQALRLAIAAQQIEPTGETFLSAEELLHLV